MSKETEFCHEDIPRVECSCGWTWTAIDALESGESSAAGVRSRFGSMAEGHAYFNRDGSHDIDVIRRDDVDGELVSKLQEMVA